MSFSSVGTPASGPVPSRVSRRSSWRSTSSMRQTTAPSSGSSSSILSMAASTTSRAVVSRARTRSAWPSPSRLESDHDDELTSSSHVLSQAWQSSYIIWLKYGGQCEKRCRLRTYVQGPAAAAGRLTRFLDDDSLRSYLGWLIYHVQHGVGPTSRAPTRIRLEEAPA